MDVAATISTCPLPSDQNRPGPTPLRDAGQTLTVTATYLLSEEGRKASLLAGGDGKAVQVLKIEVPANRLHLVSVDTNGAARLKLRPRYQLDGERGVTRVDAAPIYDAPPSLDELFREAARNHELEERFFAQRRTARTQRRDTERERRARVADAFLTDASQRAVVHPAPTQKRCYLSTEHGPLLFDATTDDEPARQVPAEANRRFRADLRERKERNRQARAEQLVVHEQKKRLVAEWIAAHGTPDQQARQAAGVLSIDEAIEAITDAVFAAANHLPRYQRDAPTRLQAYLRSHPRYSDVTLHENEVSIVSANARSATLDQWATMEQLRLILSEAKLVLREHTIRLKDDPKAPALRITGILVTCEHAMLKLRREFEAVGHIQEQSAAPA